MNLEVKYKPAILFYDSYTPEECDASLSPVIFVHGLVGLHTSWNKVWKRIADQTRRKAFVIDLRNHGKSEWNDNFALDALVTDIENFIIERDLKQCCLVGHSLGGRACLHLALIKPELIDRLVVEEMTVRNLFQEERVTMQMMFKAIRNISHFPKTMSERQIRTFLSNHATQIIPELGIHDAVYHLPLRRKSDGSFVFNFNFDVIDKFVMDGSAYHINYQNCRTFSGTALFIFFKGSPLKVYEDATLKKYFPNAKLQEFSKKVHLLHLECPDEYVENVSMFLNALKVKNNF